MTDKLFNQHDFYENIVLDIHVPFPDEININKSLYKKIPRMLMRGRRLLAFPAL
jgi:hypothetical protein